MTHLCTLQYAVGRVEPCPGRQCPFWDAPNSACMFDAVRLDLEHSPELSNHLLELRRALDRARHDRRGDGGWSPFSRLISS